MIDLRNRSIDKFYLFLYFQNLKVFKNCVIGKEFMAVQCDVSCNELVLGAWIGNVGDWVGSVALGIRTSKKFEVIRRMTLTIGRCVKHRSQPCGVVLVVMLMMIVIMMLGSIGVR